MRVSSAACFFLLLLMPLGLPQAAVADAISPSVSLTLNRPLPDTPGFHVIRGTVRLSGRTVPMDTGIFFPRAFFDSHSPLPLVITLHNRGMNGADGSGLVYEGLGMLMATDNRDNRHDGEMPEHPVRLRSDAQFVGLAPQIPAGYGWENPPIMEMVSELIDQIVDDYHLDSQRVCLTGFSYGASSTWLIAMQYPEKFAAIAPIAGRKTHDPAQDVLKLKDIAVYCAIGSNDQSIPGETQTMRDALVAAGHEPLRFKAIQGGDHWCYAALYEDPDFWNWMLSQRRGHHATTLPVVATAYPVYPQPPAITGQPPAGHGILCQQWRGIPGNNLASLTSDPSYPKYPSEQRILPAMQIPSNELNNFGTMLSGWVCPAVTGDYTFYIASDDQGRLLLSTDDSPQNLSIIARVSRWTWPCDWTQSAEQQSPPVHLLAGKRYFIEALQKDGGGDNHLAVAWKLPDGTLQGPIPADALVPAKMLTVPGPQVTEINPMLPTEAGLHRLMLSVDYRGTRRHLPALVLLPRSLSSTQKPPAIVYCPDPAQRTADGYPLPAGPIAVLNNGPLADWSPFVVIIPQAPRDGDWETPSTLRLIAVATDRLLHDLPIDRTRVYLTGSLAGGTNVWRLASRLPGRFAVVAPINGMEVSSGALPSALPSALNGTEIHIITGVKNGIATDSANKMKTALASLHPAPDVAYEMEMGDEVGRTYYGRQDFYQWLLTWSRPLGKPATQPSASTQP